tara:strand:- start:7431 stop:8216 length:786 start_codon:yes stop_codon:yes gene_type:complete
MRIATIATLFASMLSAACLSQEVASSGGPDSHSETAVAPLEPSVVLAGDARIEGLIRAKSIEIPAGATVYVTSDCVLHATEMLSIYGKIVCMDVDDRARLSSGDAPSLQLISDRTLTMRGVVLGGAGRDLRLTDPTTCAGLKGGNGTSVTLMAPDLGFFGYVRAGNGGGGGPSGEGGDGGNLTMVGDAISLHETDPMYSDVPEFDYPHKMLVGGSAGAGGDGDWQFGDEYGAGGDGGRAGGVTQSAHPLSKKLMVLMESAR